MRKIGFSALSALLIILSACHASTPIQPLASTSPPSSPSAAQSASASSVASTTGAVTSPTPLPATALPSSPTVPPPTATPSGNSKDVANAYFDAWKAGRYADMYQLLSPAAKAKIAQDAFVKRYQAISSGIGQTGLDVQLSPNAPAGTSTPGTDQIPYRVTHKLSLLGDVSEDNVLPLVVDQGVWTIDWSPDLIFKDLTTNRVVQYDTQTPTRGTIFSRDGKPLATEGADVLVGAIPGQIKDKAAFETTVGGYVKMTPDAIDKALTGAQPDWFVSLAELPASQKVAVVQKLGNVPGVVFRDKSVRTYPYGSVFAHVVGYMSPVQQSELKTLAPQGYEAGDFIGREGIEAWGEKYLAGQKGATLAIAGPDGGVIRVIAQRQAVQGDNIYTSLDVGYQTEANQVLGHYAGSLIVMNPQDNSILAIVSHTNYDPNAFIHGLSDADWKKLNSSDQPLFFRAVNGAYPTGSIFKVVTMAAGLEKGGFKPTDTFNCGLDWTGLPGRVLHNWRAEGTLNLIEGLTESCDPVFYTIGLKLFHVDPSILANFSRAFGLGKPTGVVGVPAEASGTVPDPAWKEKTLHQGWYPGDSVNMAIGQGYLLATPLQMANVYSVFADNGELRTPVLVTKVVTTQGKIVQSYTAQDEGHIPVSPQNMSYIYQGMSRVTSTPGGTAYYAFQNSKVPMMAKTGSAENASKLAHAWFVGYTPQQHATLLTLVMLEGGELGGEFAAPLGRKIVDYGLSHPLPPAA